MRVKISLASKHIDILLPFAAPVSAVYSDIGQTTIKCSRKDHESTPFGRLKPSGEGCFKNRRNWEHFGFFTILVRKLAYKIGGIWSILDSSTF